jgi:hypothetical protein
MELVPKKVDESSEWVIILGSAGTVGSFAVQVLGFCLLSSFQTNESFRLPNYAGIKSSQHVPRVTSRYYFIRRESTQTDREPVGGSPRGRRDFQPPPPPRRTTQRNRQYRRRQIHQDIRCKRFCSRDRNVCISSAR